MNPLIQLRRATQLFIVAVCFGFSPAVWAVSPPPDGGYPGSNTAEGDGALFSLTGGFENTAIGNGALGNDTGGSRNTGVGWVALGTNTSGSGNTAVGGGALNHNQTGSQNTATGVGALFANTSSNNTATGFQALCSNTNGSRNTATGENSLEVNTTGKFNTATGAEALINNNGNDNTATGFEALFTNTSGFGNTANGFSALFFNSTGSNNTADGLYALFNNNASNNTATGFKALTSNTGGHDNTADGHNALYNNTGSNNIALGSGAGGALTTGDNNIDIGAAGAAAESNAIRIGKPGLSTPKTFIAGIRGITTVNANAVPVVIDSAGQLGTVSSSQRFKKEITPMDKASEAILALKPVTFQNKSDSTNTPQFGLIAEEVAEVNPDLVARDADGKVYTVRYDAVNAMLLNEFLKAHRKMEQQEATIAKQQKQIEALTAGLQKVSNQLEVSKPAPQVAANSQ